MLRINTFELICNFLILVPQCSDKEFEDVKRCQFDSLCKTKRVWSIITYIHKSQGKSMDDFNIEKDKTQLKHEPRGGVETSMVVPMGISVSLVTRKIVQGLKSQGYFWTDTFHVA